MMEMKMSPRPKPKIILCPRPSCEAEIMIPEGVKFLNVCPICGWRLNKENEDNTQERKGELKP